MPVTESRWVFWIWFLLCWLVLAAAYFYLRAECLHNMGCSGEYGIIFIFFGMPWSMILINFLGDFIHPVIGMAVVVLGLLINAFIVAVIGAKLTKWFGRCLWQKRA